MRAPQIFGDEAGSVYLYTACCLSQRLNVFFLKKSELEKRFHYSQQTRLIYENLTTQRSIWRKRREKELSDKYYAGQMIGCDGEILNVKDLEQYIHIQQEGYEDESNHKFKKELRGCTRVSKTETKKLNLDFMQPLDILEMKNLDYNLLVEERDVSKNQMRKTQSVLDSFEIAKKLGLGGGQKSQREQKKKKDQNSTNLAQILYQSRNMAHKTQYMHMRSEQSKFSKSESSKLFPPVGGGFGR